MKTIDIFPWNDHFNTGLSRVDKQHTKLVEILNNLASHIAYNSSDKDLNTIFDELTEYTIYHFETEEAIWHQYLPDDPLDSEHQDIHQQFVETIHKLKEEQNSRPLIELAEEALGFLARWLASHILETDRYMAHLIFAIRDGLDIDAAKQQAQEKMSGSTRLLIDIILSIYSTLSSNTLSLMRELKVHQGLELQVHEQERYRDLLLNLSTDFINLPIDEIDKNIEQALERMANFVGADRAYVFDYDFSTKTSSNTYEWCGPDISPHIHELQNLPIDLFPELPIAHKKGEYVLIQDVNSMKKGPLKDLLLPQNIKSMVTCPLFEESLCNGFVGFDAVKTKHNFSASEIAILELFTKLLSNVSQRKENEFELSHERTFLKTLFQTIPDLVWTKDVNGLYLSCNSRFEDFFGAKESEIVGKTDYDFVEKPLADLFRLNDDIVMQSSRAHINEEKIPFANDGHEEILQTTKVPMFDENGALTGVMGVARDITSIKKIQQELEKERNLFEHYLNTVEAIIVALDSQGCVTLINRKGCELLEYTSEELVGKKWFEMCLIQPEGMQEVYPVFLEAMKGNLEGVEYFENHIITKSKDKKLIAWHNSNLVNDEGKIIGTLSSGEDITLLKEQQKRLEHMAHFDTLTNLPNRILLSDRLHQSMLYTQRHKSSLAIIYLDLDGFKEVNDTYGHANGDTLLQVISSRTKEILREADTLARLGGDEFVIVLNDLKNKEDSIPMLQRILNVVSTPILFKEVTMQVSASLGVTFYNYNDSIDADQLLRQADQAMYQAKLAGKNRFHIFDVENDEYLRNHNESLDEIEHALNHEEFVMYYQPKVNMKSGEFLGVEALIRWNHPEKGLLSPGAFLPIIEDHQLSIKVDSWVLNSVMKQIAQWNTENLNIPVSINISPMKLQENNFINNIYQLLKSYPNVKPHNFTFEILETSALEDMNHISYIMKECTKIGINFSLDDFGTGYSSLAYLKGLPAKQLKIDQSFVRDMLDDTDDMAILEGVISLASAFRREVIAEGVESIDQGKMLLRLGCEEAQGYVIAKPMPLQELMTWIKEWEPYIEWQKISAVSRDELPILYAMTEHKIWINEVISFLKEEKDTVIPIFNHNECRFGTWLSTQEIKETPKHKVSREIKELHHKMHDDVNALIKEYKSDSTKELDSTIEKILNYRDTFLQEFTKLLFID